MIRTQSYSFAEAYNSPIGEGNEAYGNYIENLTIDTGTNAGAIGLDYLGNNQGAVRHVTVRGQGPTCISLQRRYAGPALISDVRVEGCDTGIAVAHPEYGLTLDRVELAGQRVAGISNEGNVLSVHGLSSDNAVPAMVSNGDTAFVTLHDADLRGGAPGSSAVVIGQTASAVLRDVRSTGYRSALSSAGTAVDGADLAGWSTSRTGGGVPLDLPVPDVPGTDGTPRIVNDGAELWILGIKTEGGGTVADTRGGGRTELLGGLIYSARPVDGGDAAFRSNGSPVSPQLRDQRARGRVGLRDAARPSGAAGLGRAAPPDGLRPRRGGAQRLSGPGPGPPPRATGPGPEGSGDVCRSAEWGRSGA